MAGYTTVGLQNKTQNSGTTGTDPRASTSHTIDTYYIASLTLRLIAEKQLWCLIAVDVLAGRGGGCGIGGVWRETVVLPRMPIVHGPSGEMVDRLRGCLHLLTGLEVLCQHVV